MHIKNITRFIGTSSVTVKLFVLSFLVTSCSVDDSDINLIDEGHQYITFTVSTPYSSVPVYSISSDSENYVETIDVLAFRSEEGRELYTYRAKGEEITDKEEIDNGQVIIKKEFKVSLRKDEGINYRFVVIANATAEVDELFVAQTSEKSGALARLLSKNPGAWNTESDQNFTPIPMWGETKNMMKINDATKKISDIPMLRSIASVDVEVGEAAQADFSLSEVYLYNRKTRGRIVPIANYFNSTELKVNEVSMPLDDPADPLNIWEKLKYTTTGSELKRTIYTYEAIAAASDEEATCIVVGGKYKNGANPTYYRMDFVRTEGGAFKEFMALLRNHKYTLSITSVTDQGYNTPDEAFYGKKFGITVDIKEWNMSDMAEVEISENYFLKVSRGSFSLSSSAEYFGTVTVETNHPKGWKASTSDSWITITKTETGYFNFKANAKTSGGAREGKISVVVGNLSKEIKITQP